MRGAGKLLGLMALLATVWPIALSAQTKLWNNGNGGLIDVTTGLMWQKNTPNPSGGGFVRADYCENLSLSGSSDWRIPTLKEWFSLIDFERKTATATDTFYYDIKSYPDLNRYTRYLTYSYFPDARFPNFEFLIQFSPRSAFAGSPTIVDLENLNDDNLRIVCVANLPSE